VYKPAKLSTFPVMTEQTKEERLWQAATIGDLETVKVMAEDPAIDINWGDPEVGRTSFYRACGHGHAAVVSYLLGQPKINVNLGQSQGTSPFFIACQEGHRDVVGVLLKDPRVNLNTTSQGGGFPLYMVCQAGHRDIAQMMLAHPGVDVLQMTDEGVGSFIIACENGHLEIVRMMMDDPRVDPNIPKRSKNNTPLWFAAQNTHLEVVRYLLASWRVMDTRLTSTFNQTTAAQQARNQTRGPKASTETFEAHQRRILDGSACADLIDEYEEDPEGVRQRLRRLPGVRAHFTARIFALVVFFVDGFLQLGPSTPSSTERFLRINSGLPLELQMLLCNRLFGSPRSIVPSKDSEPAFRWLARASTWAKDNR